MTAFRQTLVVFIATAALLVCAVAVAAAATHDDDSPTPAHTVRDFLFAAVTRHDGIEACPFLSRRAQVRLEAAQPRGMSCTTAFAAHARLDLRGTIDTEAAVKALRYRTQAEPNGRERVTVSAANGASVAFVLRRATQARRVRRAAHAVADRRRARCRDGALTTLVGT
jgi:hypothetical protein